MQDVGHEIQPCNLNSTKLTSYTAAGIWALCLLLDCVSHYYTVSAQHCVLHCVSHYTASCSSRPKMTSKVAGRHLSHWRRLSEGEGLHTVVNQPIKQVHGSTSLMHLTISPEYSAWSSAYTCTPRTISDLSFCVCLSFELRAFDSKCGV